MARTVKQVEFHKDFQKDFKKLSPVIQKKFWQRLELWQEQPLHVLLNHHVLTGKLQGKHSINITGDVRAIYEERSETLVIYLLVGRHAQLYG